MRFLSSLVGALGALRQKKFDLVVDLDKFTRLSAVISFLVGARQIAGCFVDAPKVYSKNTIREDGQWLGPFDRLVEPNHAGPAYRGKVVVLIGRQ